MTLEEAAAAVAMSAEADAARLRANASDPTSLLVASFTLRKLAGYAESLYVTYRGPTPCPQNPTP